jgi:hypothetical protein
MNTHATIKELLDSVFSMRSVSYQILRTCRKESVRLVLLRTSCLLLMHLTMVSVAETIGHRKVGKDFEGSGGCLI